MQLKVYYQSRFNYHHSWIEHKPLSLISGINTSSHNQELVQTAIFD